MAPKNSATMTPTSARAKATRMPLMMKGTECGSVTVLSTCQRLARKDRAVSMRSASALRSPASVEVITGKIAIRMMIATLLEIPKPSPAVKRGARATMGSEYSAVSIGSSVWRTGLLPARIAPMASPPRMAIGKAMTSSRTVVRRWVWNCPDRISVTRASKTSAGGTTRSRLSTTYAARTCQRSTNSVSDPTSRVAEAPRLAPPSQAETVGSVLVPALTEDMCCLAVRPLRHPAGTRFARHRTVEKDGLAVDEGADRETGERHPRVGRVTDLAQHLVVGDRR